MVAATSYGRLKVAIAIAACIFLPVARASADLQSAMAYLQKVFEFEQSDLPRVFVAPGEGNDAPFNMSAGPKLIYDSPSGDLMLSIPAAVIQTGETGWEYGRLYVISYGQFLTDLSFGDSSRKPDLTAYTWKELTITGGPLTRLSIDGRDLSYDGRNLSLSETSGYTYSAANLNFGNVLSKNLSLDQFRQALGFDGTSAGTIDYYGYIGANVLQVPIGFTIVPEPSVFIEAFVAVLVLASCGRFACIR